MIYNKLIFINIYCIIVMLAGLLLSSLIMIPFLIKLLKPINILHDATVEISRGNFDIELNINTNDEFHELSEGMTNMSRKVKLLLERVREEEKLKQLSELQKLSLQMNPHFIYNTLNTLKILAKRQNAQDVVELTTAFISLTQNILRNSRLFSTLKNELSIVDNYLRIQKYCYGDVFDFTGTVEEELLSCRVPRMFLQPFIENSIFHGIIPIAGIRRGSICIQVLKEADSIIIILTDNGIGFDTGILSEVFENDSGNKKEAGNRIGVKNITDRLNLLYCSDFSFLIESQPDRGTNIRIVLPFEKDM